MRVFEFNIDPALLTKEFRIVGGSYELGEPIAFARNEAPADELQLGMENAGKRGVYRTSDQPIHITSLHLAA